MPNLHNDYLASYKKVGVLGLGITGRAVYKFFLKNNIDLVCWDDNIKSREDFLANFPESIVVNFEEWKDCSHIVVSPGVPLYYPKKHAVVHIAEQNNIEITSDNEIFYNLLKENAKFVAITGTNGKSTTTALVEHILKESGVKAIAGGNIGTSVLDLPLDKDIYVMELSSYQLETVKNFKANYAVFLNVTPDHLERYGTIENYTNSKKRIFNNQDMSDYVIIGVDNPIAAWVFEEQRIKFPNCVGISGSKEFRDNKNIVCCEDNLLTDNFWKEELEVKENIHLHGKHNRENFCAAYAVCSAIGVDGERIVKNMQSFVGLPHRMQFLGNIGHVGFYNDSKATNADAAKPALEYLENIHWLAGGKAKKGGISSLNESYSNIEKAYLFGEAAKEFSYSLEGNIQYEIFSNLEEAARQAFDEASSKKNPASILLSPACSSLDQFKNFEERGNHFIEIYNNYKNASARRI